MQLDLDRVVTDTAAVAAVVGEEPAAEVRCYDGWSLVDLAAHLGRIHRWVTGIVADRATARPTGPMATPPPDEELPKWLADGADRLVTTLDEAPPDAEVWTFSRGDDDVAFWRQRMVLETALHRWDAEDAAGATPSVDERVALAGVEEALLVYLAQRLGGADVGGAGQRVAVVPEGDEGWTVTLHPDDLEVVWGRVEPDAVVTASALDLWLLLTCRRDLDGLTVEGDHEAAALLVRAARLVPGPAA